MTSCLPAWKTKPFKMQKKKKKSYDVAVIRWIMSCHKNCMTTLVITLWHIYLTSLTTSVSTMCCLIKVMLISKVIKCHFKGSYNRQNLTLVVILYEIYETR